MITEEQFDTLVKMQFKEHNPQLGDTAVDDYMNSEEAKSEIERGYRNFKKKFPKCDATPEQLESRVAGIAFCLNLCYWGCERMQKFFHSPQVI